MKVAFRPPPAPMAANSPPTTGRSLVLVTPPRTPKAVSGTGRNFIESPLKQVLIGVNARAISPRALQALSQDLYAGGVLTWDEHAALSFQAELHPDFKRTIGALTGDTPLPDHPRDFVKEWESRLDFERRHFPEGESRERAGRILSVLRRIEAPTDINA